MNPNQYLLILNETECLDSGKDFRVLSFASWEHDALASIPEIVNGKHALQSWRAEHTEPVCHTAHSGKDTDCFPVILTCSDEGLRRAKEEQIPAVAVRSPEYEKTNGPQSLFQAELLLETADALEYQDLDRICCRFRNLPLIVGSTERCVIRELSEPDLPELFSVLEGRIYENGRNACQTDRETFDRFWSAYIRNQYRFFDYGLWAAVHPNEKRRLIGVAGLDWIADAASSGLPDGSMEMFYLIREEERRKGYAKEICGFLNRHAAEAYGIKELYLLIDRSNEPSVRLAQSLGYVRMDRTIPDSGGECHKTLHFRRILDIM